MKKHRAMEVEQYNFTSQDKLFFDANIWLYLFGPQQPMNYCVNIYSKLFSDTVNAKSQIYIDVLVVSEFINRYVRLEWELFGQYTDSFKDFRNSVDFPPVAQGVVVAVKFIMKHCRKIESGYANLDIDSLMENYADGESDFNDLIIIELCKNYGLTLVTHDGDFNTQEIPILTANRSLLNN